MVGGTKFHRAILKASLGRMSKIKSNTIIKTLYEGKIKTQNPFGGRRVS